MYDTVAAFPIQMPSTSDSRQGDSAGAAGATGATGAASEVATGTAGEQGTGGSALPVSAGERSAGPSVGEIVLAAVIGVAVVVTIVVAAMTFVGRLRSGRRGGGGAGTNREQDTSVILDRPKLEN